MLTTISPCEAHDTRNQIEAKKEVCGQGSLNILMNAGVVLSAFGVNGTCDLWRARKEEQWFTPHYVVATSAIGLGLLLIAVGQILRHLLAIHAD
jgi:hypothetical protein